MSLLNRAPYVPYVLAWSTCACAKVPNACQLLIFLSTNVPINVLTCQRCTNYLTWCANMPKANQFFNFACQKAYQFFNYFSNKFFNFLIFQLYSAFANFKNIWAILENLWSKEFKFWHLQNFIKENLVSLTPLTSFSMEPVGLTEQLFG